MPKKEKILFENTNIPVEAEIADNYKSIKFVNTNIPVPCDTSIKYRKKLKFKTTNRTVKIADMCPSNYAEDSRIFMQDSKLRIYGTTIKFVARFKDNIIPEHDLNSFRIAMIQTEYNLADAHDFVIGGYVRGTVNANNGCETDEDEQGYYVGVNLGSIPASKLGTIMSGRICYTYQGKTYYCPLADVPTPPVYTVTPAIQNGTAVAPTECYKYQEFDITVTPSEGYVLPDTVIVLGCTSTYNKATGVIHCSNPVGNVSVNVVCEEPEYLYFLSPTNGTMKFAKDSNAVGQLYYSYDKSIWEPYESNSDVNIVADEPIYWKGSFTSIGTSGIGKFSTTVAELEAYGEVNSLNNFGSYVKSIYQWLFNMCTALTKAPKMSSTNLSENCYFAMYKGCTGLVEAPELPALELESNCYNSMFFGCTSLTKAPELPALILASNCYASMFRGCTSLTQAPSVLPALELKANCYDTMFYQTQITVSPELMFETVASHAADYMFEACSSLSTIKLHYTGEFGTSYFDEWVSGVSSTGDFYYNGSSTTRGNSAIPTNWTIHTF